MNYSTGTSRTLRLAEEVRVEAARKRLTMASLAQGSDMTYQTLRRRLAGTHPFTVDELERVAAVLGVTVTELYARTEQAA